MILITVYCIQFIPVTEFFNEFQELLEDFKVRYEDYVIAGDVNIHVESDESSSRKFKNVMEMLSFPIEDLKPFLEYLALLISGVPWGNNEIYWRCLI